MTKSFHGGLERPDADPAPAADAAAGRSCPLHYRYAPEVFAAKPQAGFDTCEVLYVVGGVYGNEPALERIVELFDRERGRKRLVFNGDFHWFDVDPESFGRIQQTVLAFDALRGNVETELADPTPGADAGCGCAYPEWVDDGTVERSNRIAQRLHRAADADPRWREQLAALPMWRRADVGGVRIAIVHGDAQSLAGWGFAQESLRNAAQQPRLARWFDAAQVDVFASSHTCLPVFHTLRDARRRIDPTVLNNGAAGMPNFRGDAAGLLTRIAVEPFAGAQRRHGVVRGGVHMDAIAIDHDARRWQREFLRQWDTGSDAHASYWERICAGPAYAPEQALSVATIETGD